MSRRDSSVHWRDWAWKGGRELRGPPALGPGTPNSPPHPLASPGRALGEALPWGTFGTGHAPEVRGRDDPLRDEVARLRDLSSDTRGTESGLGPTSPVPEASGLAATAHSLPHVVYAWAFPTSLAVAAFSSEISTAVLVGHREDSGCPRLGWQASPQGAPRVAPRPLDSGLHQGLDHPLRAALCGVGR